MEISFGSFLNSKSCIDAEIAEIISEGSYQEIDDKFTKKKKKVFNLDVKYKNNDMVYSPTDSQGNTLIKAWGNDTKQWIGKKFQTFLVEGKMIVKPL